MGWIWTPAPGAPLTAELVIRLIVAGVLGAVIGLEREYRAKEAGMRTHFLVAMGSSLIMVVSQFGFAEDLHYDASRVAAQIVSGIGFIGAGTIMMRKQFVQGLTTAAGLWVVAGIGMAIGGGLYIVGIAGTILTLLGLEVLQRIVQKLHVRRVELVFSTKSHDNLVRITDVLNRSHYRVDSCNISAAEGKSGKLTVKMTLSSIMHHDNRRLQFMLKQMRDVEVEKLE